MANPVVLRRTDTIGSADAEYDHEFLKDCFVDNGQLAALLDCSKPQCVILGRTGAGKTALLLEIQKRVEHLVELSPETLALNYLTNSAVITFFETAGVHLDAFYKLLWQHVFCVELIKAKYGISNEQKQRDFLSLLRGVFVRDRAKEAAFKYLEQWGQEFWQETNARVKEFTTKLETALQAKTGLSTSLVQLGADGAVKLSREEKAEVVQHGQEVVNSLHLQDLHNLIEVLNDDIFDDSKNAFYLVIDRLDENWVDDRIRYKLIRALIEAVRSFRRIRNVKVLVALRTDLLFSVLQRIPQAGFQSEKYETLYSRVSWTRELLVRILDKRIASLFRRKYTGDVVRLQDILPSNQIDQRSAVDYLLDRTFFRPRDAIMFVNECIQRADGRSKISVDLLRAAESTHSTNRLNSLVEEWGFEYPCLKTTASIVSRRANVFPVSDIGEEDALKLATQLLLDFDSSNDPIVSHARRYVEATKADFNDFVLHALAILYQVGVIGMKLAPHLAVQWSYLDEPMIQPNQISPTTGIHVHKTFWLALNVTTRNRR